MNDTAFPSSLPPDFTAKAAQAEALADESSATTFEAVTNVACDTTDAAKEATRKVIHSVRNHPLEAAAVAIGAGLLVWWLVSRQQNSA